MAGAGRRRRRSDPTRTRGRVAPVDRRRRRSGRRAEERSGGLRRERLRERGNGGGSVPLGAGAAIAGTTGNGGRGHRMSAPSAARRATPGSCPAARARTWGGVRDSVSVPRSGRADLGERRRDEAVERRGPGGRGACEASWPAWCGRRRSGWTWGEQRVDPGLGRAPSTGVRRAGDRPGPAVRGRPPPAVDRSGRVSGGVGTGSAGGGGQERADGVAGMMTRVAGG